MKYEKEQRESRRRARLGGERKTKERGGEREKWGGWEGEREKRRKAEWEIEG